MTKLRNATAVACAPLLIGVLFASLIQACGDDDAPADTTQIDAGADTTTSPPIDSSSNDTGALMGRPLWKSGTRLRAEVLQAGEAKRFDTFFDTARNEICELRGVGSTDAENRCIPTRATIVGYDDAACQTPIAAYFGDGSCLENAKYLLGMGMSTDPCAHFNRRVLRVWLRGAEIPARPLFHQGGDGSCNPQLAIPSQKYYGLGAEVPLTEFVRATVVKEEASAALSRDRFQGEDGSELIRGSLFDRARGDAPCEISTFGPSNARVAVCAGSPLAYTEQQTGPFADPNCTANHVAATQNKQNCPPRVIVRREPFDAGPAANKCLGPDYNIIPFAVGAPVTTPVFSPGGTGCAQRTDPRERFFAIGAAIDPATLPATPLTFFGNGRIRIQAMASAGVQLERGQFYDDQTYCSVALFSDNKEYCVSDDTLYANRTITQFKDANCTQPIYLVNPCSTQNLRFLITAPLQLPGCNGANYDAVGFGVGQKLAITQYWEKSDGVTCTGPTQLPPGADIPYDVLAQEPVSNKLVEVKRVRE